MKKFDEELIKIVISLILFIVSILIKQNVIKMILLVISYLTVSIEMYKNAFNNIKNKEFFDENTLMIIGSISAMLIGEYLEAVMIIILYTIGEYLSDKAVDKSKEKISDLIDLRSNKITLKIKDEYEIVDTTKAKIGDTFIVKPGEKVPLDGIIIDGISNIDTKSLTGESIPRKVKKNDSILSGSINLDSLLVIKATSEYNTSTASKIMEFLENANNNKNKTEKFITKFSKIYTPVVLILAVIVLITSIILGNDLNQSIYTTIVFLVTSCPCALVLSVPLSYFVGIGKASHEGILVKGSTELENLSKVKRIAFDKTGTITKGTFEVSKINPVNIKKEELLKIAAYAEYYSNHPIAKSILNKYKKKIDTSEIKDFKEISGKGIKVHISGEDILIGNEKLMEEYKIKYVKSNEVGTIVYIASSEYLGNIVISDVVKDTSINAIRDLKNIGINDLIILSGDNKNIVENIADIVGIDKYYSELLPMDKVEHIKNDSKFTAFVGDGINDAPVLKVSDLGISMGNIGSDVAIEASDVVIMHDDLTKIVEAIKISKKTNKIVRENIIFAIIMKMLILIFALFGYTAIWMAVFADVGVTLLAVLNTLRIMIKVR